MEKEGIVGYEGERDKKDHMVRLIHELSICQ